MDRKNIISPAIKQASSVMPDLIRHPVPAWIPAFAGMTTLMYLVAGVIITPAKTLIFLLLYYDRDDSHVDTI